MGNVRQIIKTVLNEAAGISFEVREWAKIIEEHVDGEIKKFRANIPDEEVEKPDYSRYGSSGVVDLDDYENFDVDPTMGFTHFEYLNSNDTTDTAYVYGDDLQINADVLEEFPDITNQISGKLFQVYLPGHGEFEISMAQGSYMANHDILNGVKEMVEDHAVTGGLFYDLNYDYLYAAQDDGEDINDIPNDDYDGWRDISSYYQKGEEGAGRNWWGFGSSWKPKPLPEMIEINGKQYPEAYEKFQVDKWVITNSGRVEYDHWRSGYNDDGNYVVYLNMPMGSIGGTMLVHEIKHSYDDWNRMRHGGKPIRDSWEIQNIYTKDFEKLVLGGSFKLHTMLSPLIRYYYLASKLESPAYLENVYDHASDYRNTAKKLMSFKASNFLNKKGEAAKGLQESWENMLIDYNIPFYRKYPDVRDFLRVTEKYFNKRGKTILRKIDKMMYVHDRGKPAPVNNYNLPTRGDDKGPTSSGDGLPY